MICKFTSCKYEKYQFNQTTLPMKKVLGILLFLIPFTVFGQKGITFKVEELSKPEKLLREQEVPQIYEKLIQAPSASARLYSSDIFLKHKFEPSNTIVKTSDLPDSLVNFGANSFFYGMYQAYADHRPFVLSPDMVWLLISQGFARHVNANPEDMRGSFVGFSGKQTLLVSENRSLYDPDISWERIVSNFTGQIGENVGKDLVELLSCNFSTTTHVEKMASEITIMESMKPYFEFVVMRVICGIPEITLQGTPEDWQKILDKAQKLKKYDLKWWISELEPVLKEFVKTSKGRIDTVFWQNMFKEHSPEKYGSPKIIDGWIVKFFPYDKKGKRNNLEKLEGGDNLPDEIVKVDFNFLEVSDGAVVTTPLELWAGFIGLEQNSENFALTPKISWMVRKKDFSEEENLKKQLEGQIKNGAGIKISVQKFPEIILKLEEIHSLDINFTGTISIPDELAKVRIRTLILSGKITDAEKERIKNMFPGSTVKINEESIN